MAVWQNRIDAELQGMPEVLAKLERLTGSEQRRVIRSGAAAAAQVQIKYARQQLRSNGSDRKRRTDDYIKGGKKRRGMLTGLARSFMKMPSSKWPNASAMRRMGKIGSRVGFRKRMGAHAHLVEHGHRMVTAAGDDVGFVRPYPFMRPVMDSKRSEFRAAFENKIKAGIKRILRKQGLATPEPME